MALQRYPQSANDQAALLFAVAGSLGLVSELFLREGSIRVASAALNLSGLACAAVVRAAPWARWSSSATLALVPVGFGLLAVGQRVAPGAPSVYGVWFVVVFAWVGFWHAPRTALALAPLGALAYVGPFVGVPTTPTGAISSVAIAIPAGAILGEVLAAKMQTIRRTEAALVEARTLLERANLTDDLTGVGNRRRANALLDSLEPGDGVVLMDLDHFKVVNDTMGHAEGDRVLTQMGEYLRSAVRDVDTVARFGGEEFLVVLRQAGQDAHEVSMRLVEGWRELGPAVTLSAGAAVHRAGRGPSDTFRAADTALYAAKTGGRDRAALEPVGVVVS
jgi:diguanylate cyclase (GGDEF)-like protein